MKQEFTNGQTAIYLLRHQQGSPEISNDGWAGLDELIQVMVNQGRKVDRKELIADLTGSGRVEFTEDYTKVLAAHGHSNGIEIVRKMTKPPEFLYHGTGMEKALWIKAVGLKQKGKMIHLIADIELAKKFASGGKRIPLVYRIDALKMHEDGFEFYLSTNSVWLAKEIPTKYLHIQKM